MSHIPFKITNAGLALIAQVGSIGPVVLTKLAVGSGSWATSPTGSETALKTEIKKLDLTGDNPVDGKIHLTATDSGTDAYSVKEIGLFTSGNVLFAIAGGTDDYLTKASVSTLLVAVDLTVANYPSGSITVGNTNFLFTQATETIAGIAEIATQAEVSAGTSDSLIVSPKKLANANYLQKSGGTMTGNLILNADPTSSLQSATKNYVDTSIYTHSKNFPLIITQVSNLGNGTWSNYVIWSEGAVCGFKQILFSLNSPIYFGAVNGDNDGEMAFKLELIAKADAEATEYVLACKYYDQNGKPWNSISFVNQSFLTPSNVDLTNKKLKLRVSAYTGWGGDYFVLYQSYGSISYTGVGLNNGTTVLTTGYNAKSQVANLEGGSMNNNYTIGGHVWVWGNQYQS